MKTGSKLAIFLFTLVAVAHAWRVVAAIPVLVGTWQVPMWVSLLGILVPGLVALQLWKESR
ncbi:MAG: hypothetical protein R3348_06115 [Xanthomonadales bacterium]|nr:hypothetical protein [Xanthomonadales bacterium]